MARQERDAMRHERFEVEPGYARHPEGDLAYRVFCQSQRDLLFLPNWLTNAEVMWDEPSLAAYLQRLATFSRVICFDRRGTGVSDPVMLSSLPTLDSWMDDARVVMDTVGSTRAALLGDRSEEHTSELQSHLNLVCRLLLEKQT